MKPGGKKIFACTDKQPPPYGDEDGALHLSLKSSHLFVRLPARMLRYDYEVEDFGKHIRAAAQSVDAAAEVHDTPVRSCLRAHMGVA
eukprot:3042278-Amphidinium_carterae.2